MPIKHVGFGLSIAAIACFIPGIILPMFLLNTDMVIALSGAGFETEIVNKELSIITTVSELWQDQRYLVSFLIFAFSVIIPAVKTSLVTSAYFIKDLATQQKITSAMTVIGKWSMADVFVVAVFLAILSTNHAQNVQSHELNFLGMKIGFNVSTQTLSNIGNGFYFFVSYCILSLLGSQMMLNAINKNNKQPQLTNHSE